MKISKNKDIRTKVTLFATSIIVFSTAFLCILTRSKLDLVSFLIILAVSLGLICLIWLICFLLIKYEEQYYLIEEGGIKLYKKDELLFALNTADIIELHYIKFSRVFLMQMGSGYLNLTYLSQDYKEAMFSTMFPTGKAIHSISMSLKQAKAVAKVLRRYIRVT